MADRQTDEGSTGTGDLSAASRKNAEALAAFFGRTPGAIDFAWRWMDADVDRFPAKAFNRLFRLIQQVRADLGPEARGSGFTPASEVA